MNSMKYPNKRISTTIPIGDVQYSNFIVSRPKQSIGLPWKRTVPKSKCHLCYPTVRS